MLFFFAACERVYHFLPQFSSLFSSSFGHDVDLVPFGLSLLVSRVLRLREDRPRTGLRFEQTAIPGRPFFLFHRCFFRLSVPVLLFCAYFLPYPFVCFPSSNYFHIIFVPRSFSLFVFCWTVFVSWWFFVLLFRSRNLVNLFSPDEITATPV